MKTVASIGIFMMASALLAEPMTKPTPIEIGEKLSAALIQKLGGELKANMTAHGPVAALGFCSANAIKLTNEVSDNSGGYTVKRVSLKERNPSNRPNGEESALLKEWEGILALGQTLPPYALKPSSKGQTYYKPLIINNEACLKCHGNVESASELGKAISAAYPKDKATGYKMGDLRGMIVVDIPAKIEN